MERDEPVVVGEMMYLLGCVQLKIIECTDSDW